MIQNQYSGKLNKKIQVISFRDKIKIEMDISSKIKKEFKI